MASENIFLPEIATIKKIVRQTGDVKTFLLDRESGAEPGQFYGVAVFQYGEAPISAGSARGERLALSVKAIGTVTRKMHKLRVGDEIGLRGPFGNGWPKLGGDVALVGGGIGLPPLRSFMLSNLKRCRMQLFYGARTPADLVFRDEYERWRKLGIEVNLTVDRGAPGWKGATGPVTNIMASLPRGTKVLICGPPIMIKFVVEKCESLGIKKEGVFISMERLMRCGVGKCGHCMIGGSYVCTDGPVYRADAMPSEQE